MHTVKWKWISKLEDSNLLGCTVLLHKSLISHKTGICSNTIVRNLYILASKEIFLNKHVDTTKFIYYDFSRQYYLYLLSLHKKAHQSSTYTKGNLTCIIKLTNINKIWKLTAPQPHRTKNTCSRSPKKCEVCVYKSKAKVAIDKSKQDHKA
jgi:hypothetical protein